MWVVADTAIKLAGESALPSYEIVAVEGLVLATLLIVQRAVRGDIRLLWPAQPRRQFLRACLDLGNVLCVAVALRHLPLNLFYILVFSAPMVITIGAWLFLQEELHLREALAILTGFAGVAIAVNPFAPHGSGEGIGYAACAIAVLCFSASIVWLRRMTQTERLDSLMFSSASVSALGGGIAMLWHAVPLDPKRAALLAITGIAVGLGNLFSFQALRLISAATVSHYHYTQLVTGGTAAWLIWHEVPGWPLLAGAALIIASGLYVAAQGA